MTAMTVGVVRESAAQEHRVGLTPDGVTRLRAAGHEVLVEAAAGVAAWFPDQTYADAGAKLVTKEQLYTGADVVVCVQPPAPTDRSLLRPGQALIGLLQPLTDPRLAEKNWPRQR